MSSLFQQERINKHTRWIDYVRVHGCPPTLWQILSDTDVYTAMQDDQVQNIATTVFEHILTEKDDQWPTYPDTPEVPLYNARKWLTSYLSYSAQVINRLNLIYFAIDDQAYDLASGIDEDTRQRLLHSMEEAIHQIMSNDFGIWAEYKRNVKPLETSWRADRARLRVSNKKGVKGLGLPADDVAQMIYDKYLGGTLDKTSDQKASGPSSPDVKHPEVTFTSFSDKALTW